MAAGDPLETQRTAVAAVRAELSAAGFEDGYEIGRGGFGVVYRCVQTSLDRTVAVKVLTADLDEENRARFFREQRAMGLLTGHPNIITVLQVGATNSGRPYIVMPYCPQDSLEVRIRNQGPLEVHDALRLGVKMAGALETAHRLGILHRDVKPGNILLTDYGEPALTDFGIAHVAGGFETATGTVTGSPAFTAPEVLKGESPSPVSDLYSLGATLFCAITGHAAFERRSGEQVVAQFLRITTHPAPDLREHGLPGDVSEVVGRSMSADPCDRPASAAELGDALRQVQFRNGFPVDEMALHAEQGDGERGWTLSGGARTTEPLSGNAQRTSADAGEPSGQAEPSEGDVVPTPARLGKMGNLPVELTSFVGRRRELTETKKMLSDSRLVTLTGIGGVGKTRLALRVAGEVRRGFADGVWLVELGGLSDGSLLPDAVAAALGLRDQSVRPAREIVLEHVAPRHLLLILDNCEQVVDAVAVLAEALLRACPELRVLATSRERLAVGGEVALRVPPLGVPDPDREPDLQALPQYDAVTLFVERAAAAVPAFALTPDNRVTVIRICQQLDGLPLPIELAAARLRAMSAAQILDHLTDRYRLLSLGARGAPSRQQTLRLCIDWSHGLCTPSEQQAWARLSVFAGGFELDAAEGIYSGDLTADDLLDVVASLVDKSILIREEPGAVVRYRLLETLRDYGREKLQESSDYVSIRRRHRDWYQHLVLQAEAEWISGRQLEWIARLERERQNLREALEFCVTEPGESGAGLRLAGALYWFWFSRGLLSEGRRSLDRALSSANGRPTADRVKVVSTASLLAGRQGDFEAAAELIDECREMVEQLDDPHTYALVAYADGRLALFGGELSRAITHLTKAVRQFHAEGDLLWQISTQGALALAHALHVDTRQAISYCEEAMAITQSHGEVSYRSYFQWTMALAVWRQGELGRATTLLEESLHLARLVDDPLATAWCLEILAWIAADNKHSQRAGVLLGAADLLRHTVGSPTVMVRNTRTYHEQCEQQVLRALGQRAFDAARSHGQSLGTAEAIAYALGEESPIAKPRCDVPSPLTKREQQVADLVAQGLTNKAIAAHLVISQRTAQGHVEHILTKLGFTSRAQIAAWVVEHEQRT
ncbi:protein kinase (plasmid) [Rhodococcus opacus]|uniref:Protein kinase/ LuxR family transcriptional regulator n=1 Tax=Rhodococcus opacus M213 TaxID=1129896 RepID=K8XKS9_RHOOP|nr:protein kinase [Rhodococcus opacus]EKT81431.1 protein kinase/ LuxR family transcriptional regulator [Rhodococcus opacus M213]WKN59939.1 protein kinase [Rhodococcus opacus]